MLIMPQLHLPAWHTMGKPPVSSSCQVGCISYTIQLWLTGTVNKIHQLFFCEQRRRGTHLVRSETMCDELACAVQIHSQRWSLDLRGRLTPTTVRLAGPVEDSEGTHAIDVRWPYDYSKQDQTHLHSNRLLLLQPNQSMSPRWHHHWSNPVAAHDLFQITYQYQKGRKYLVLRMEGCIHGSDYLQKLLRYHHKAKAMSEKHRQRLGCTKLLHPKVECCKFHWSHCVRKQQRRHHFGEATCAHCLQKPACMKPLHPEVECYNVHGHCFRKLRHDRHFGEARCDLDLQKLGCRKYLHPQVECCIVPKCCFRKLRHNRHFGEALCDKPLHQPGYMTFLHPKVECCIVLQCCLRKLQHGHHFE